MSFENFPDAAPLLDIDTATHRVTEFLASSVDPMKALDTYAAENRDHLIKRDAIADLGFTCGTMGYLEADAEHMSQSYERGGLLGYLTVDILAEIHGISDSYLYRMWLADAHSDWRPAIEMPDGRRSPMPMPDKRDYLRELGRYNFDLLPRELQQIPARFYTSRAVEDDLESLTIGFGLTMQPLYTRLEQQVAKDNKIRRRELDDEIVRLLGDFE